MTKIWAHRGASAYAPENTLAAFELALEMGAEGIEFDVQRTADGHLVVIHDETVDRTSDGSGAVVDLTLEQLRRFDFSNGFEVPRRVGIPTLAEVLELCRPTDITINIELKDSVEAYPGMGLEALAAARDAGVVDRALFSSFNHDSLATLRGHVAPESLGLLYAGSYPAPWTYATGFGAGAIHPNLADVDSPRFVEAAHGVGIRVNCWTMGEKPAMLQRALDLGVDAIITNFPDLGVQAVHERA